MNDLDKLVYGGKKISRGDLEHQSQSENEQSDQLNQVDDEYDEEIDSDVYGSEDNKELNNDDEDQDLEMESSDSEQIEESKVVKLSNNQKQGQKNQQNNFEGEDDLDLALQQLKQEEKEESKYIQKRVSSDLQKAKSVKTQKKLFDNFLHQRILMQKLLQHANKLPNRQLFDLFQKESHTMQQNTLSCKRNLKKHIKDLVKLQKQLFTISETSININLIKDKDEDNTNVDEVFQVIDSNFSKIKPFVEETVDRWNNRTMLIKNLQGNGNSKSKAFGKTILEQVNSILTDDQSKVKLIEKSHLKRDSYKVFGRSMDDLTQERDNNIYNDFDFYQILLKDFLVSSNDQDGVDDGNGAVNGYDENDIYLDGADLNLTQKFIERKRKLAQSGQQKIKKEVDRKASKNRKIRYVVHEKIVNFMTPQDNFSDIFEGKESILKTLFGQVGQELQTNNQSDEVKGKKKKGQKQNKDYEEDELKFI